jgi:hypothetical protein
MFPFKMNLIAILQLFASPALALDGESFELCMLMRAPFSILIDVIFLPVESIFPAVGGWAVNAKYCHSLTEERFAIVWERYLNSGYSGNPGNGGTRCGNVRCPLDEAPKETP